LTGAAAARLYDDHVDAVHAMGTRRVGPQRSPAITGEAFEHALRTWDRFDADRGTERLFLYGAAAATLRRHQGVETEHLRALRTDRSSITAITDPLIGGPRPPRPNSVEGVPGTSVEHDAHDESPARTMLRAIADLSPDDRDIVLLALWESLPHGAIAEALDLSVGTVRSALGRIRRELKVATAGTTE
jgi:RNA polymerase sigma-70 factor (ECF subfamily)